MADRNTTGAVHLTSLDLDISGVRKSLEEIKSGIENTAREIPRIFNSTMSENETIDWLKSIGIIDKNLYSAKTKIQELAQEVGNFSKLQVTAKDGDLFQAIVTHSDKAGNSIRQVIDLTKNLKDTTRKYTVTEDVSKLEKQYEKVERQIEKVTTKLSALEKVGKTGGIRKEATELKNEFQSLYEQIKNGTISVDEAKARFNELGNSFEQLNLKAKTATGGIEGLLLRLSEKAKWMVAYQVVNLVQQALGNVVGTIKETEDATIELQRVLNNPPDTKAISDALYDIGYRYGQSFENVQKTAVLFAQTGQDWEQVLASVEATMLGLNTAELEVTTATNGLIAVMSQFHIEATDLEEVIDKINITADNFPITSEKIVAALQRAGGTAYNFGLTLEETIGVITALGEATGRSGEQIGTALNSLITFSMKPESLMKFSEFLGGVSLEGKNALEVWQLLGAKIDDSGEKLAKMMAGSKEFADLFSEEMATAIGLTDEYNAAVMNSQDVYSTVGTYRQNYFIGLINNIDRVIEVLNNMTDAEGYSAKENEKAMEALSKQWEQLVNTAKELAVQFGEGGFLYFLKFLTSASTETLKLIKNIGGLNTIIGALVTALVMVKKQKISDLILSVPGRIKNIISSLKNLVSQLNFVKVAQESYNAALDAGKTKQEAFAIAVSSSLGGISLIITVLFAAVNAWNSYNKSLEEARQKTIQISNEASESISSLYDSYKKLKEAQDSGSTDDLIEAQKQLLEYFGYSVSDISKLEERYGSLDKAIQQLTQDEYELLKARKLAGAEAAEQSLKDIDTQGDLNFSFGTKESVESQKLIKANQNWNEFIDSLKNAPKTIDEAKQHLETLQKAEQLLSDTMTTPELKDNPLYHAITEQIDVLGSAIKQVDDYNDELKIFAEANTWEEYFNKLAESEQKGEDALKNSADAMDNTGISAEQLQKYIETLSEAFNELSGKVDDFQSAYATVIDVIEEYNETGIMTADMLQKILELEPEYIAMIDVSTDSLGLNEQAVGNLINTNDNYLQQLIALKVAKEADAMASSILAAQNDNVAISEINAANAASTLQAQLQNAVIACINGTGSATDLANALRQVGQEAGLAGEYLEYFTQQGMKMANTLGSLYGKINRGTIGTYYTPRVSTGGSGKKSGSGSSANNAAKEALQTEIKAWQKQKEAVNDYYKDLEENLKKQKQESDDYYDGLIENLKKVEEANDRINAQLDYYTNRQKLLRNIEQAQARSGIEWREKEADYQQQLVDLDEEWRRKLEDWSIDDRIEELQLLKKQAQDIVDDQIEELKKLKEAAISQIEEMIDKLQEKVSALGKSTGSAVASGISSGAGAGISSLGKAWEDYSAKAVEESNKVTQTISKDTHRVIDLAKKAMKDPLETMNYMLENPISKMRELQQQGVQTAQQTGLAWQKNFSGPVNLGLDSIQQRMLTNMVKSAEASSKGVMNQYTNNFINPLSNSLNNVLRKAKMDSDSYLRNIQQAYSATRSSGSISSGSTTNTVNMYNNMSTAATATSAVQRLTNFFTNPSKR